jgi:hypothetical protein
MLVAWDILPPEVSKAVNTFYLFCPDYPGASAFPEFAGATSISSRFIGLK